MKAIETTYNGYRFRSRLEAKWAYVFDRLGWRWEYEPIDLNGYIPDFHVNFGRSQCFVEIKPSMTAKELEPAYNKAINAIHSECNHEEDPCSVQHQDLLVLGGGIGTFDAGRWLPIAIYDNATGFYGDDKSYMAVCPTCYLTVPLTIYGLFGFPCCPCPGDTHKHYMSELPVSSLMIRDYWAEAHNATRWKPAR